MLKPERLHAKAIEVLASSVSVPSPCTSVCRINSDTGLCEGCFRTLDEIVAWSRLSDEGADGKRHVWSRIHQRAELML